MFVTDCFVVVYPASLPWCFQVEPRLRFKGSANSIAVASTRLAARSILMVGDEKIALSFFGPDPRNET